MHKIQQEYLNQSVGAELLAPGQAALVVDMAPKKVVNDQQDIDTVQNYRRADSKLSKPSTSGSANVTSINQQKRRQVLLSNSRGVKRDFPENELSKGARPEKKLQLGANH